MLKKTSRVMEDIEWSISYSFNSNDVKSPRVLLVGDSICNGYQQFVRENLGSRLNITYWISSKCVTDPRYLRELDFQLDFYDYDMIMFNNGCHSSDEFPEERETAYKNTVEFIMAKCENTPLALVLTTPGRKDDVAEKHRRFNEETIKLAEEKKLPVLDLFTPMMALDRTEAMLDDFHWKEEIRKEQAEIVTKFILDTLNPDERNLVQLSSKKGPSGEVK